MFRDFDGGNPQQWALSGSFLGIGSLVFSETLYGVRIPYGDVHDRARFFFERPSSSKNNQKLSKMAQEWGFWPF